GGSIGRPEDETRPACERGTGAPSPRLSSGLACGSWRVEGASHRTSAGHGPRWAADVATLEARPTPILLGETPRMLQPPVRISNGRPGPSVRRGGPGAQGADPIPEGAERSPLGFGGRGRD